MIDIQQKPKRATGLTIAELRRAYKDRSHEIRARLADFRKIRETASDERLFEELAFCIFTAAASARMGLRAVERVRPVLMTGSMRQIQRTLLRTHRWPRARGAFVFQTREYLREHCHLRIRDLLATMADAQERRDFFASNRGIRGLAYKESSHFLRNIGYTGYAILDKHVIARLFEFGVTDTDKPPSTRIRYLDTERRMMDFARSIRIDFDELDLLLWYTKTGEILK
jgi:N-glycosylase/DNA lyase